MKKYTDTTIELMDFIEKNPSCYHVIASFCRQLDEAGFSRLYEQSYWNLTPGKSYYVVRSDSSIIAFKLPSDIKNTSYHIVAAHSDSPSFKIKENPELPKEKHYISLNVEKYGGMLCAPWFDRPLSVAGRILVSENGALKTKLVNIDKDLLMLPSLAIHMNPDANKGHAYQIQKEMVPLFSSSSTEGGFTAMIAEAAGVDKAAILGNDLFMYNRSKACIWGENAEYFSSPRLDDIQCAYSAVSAFLASDNDRNINLCCIFDNEEVGSRTKQGADSTFLSDILERISSCLNMTSEENKMAIASGFMVSADNGHAVHPNYPEKNDPTNRAYMNEGVLIKYNANQKYTTDAVSAGIFKAICRKAHVPFQVYVNNSDVAGGSTLGNISNAHISLNTIDIGAAQLAMHSPYETAGVKDTHYLIQAMTAFYNSHISITADGYVLE